MDERTGSFWVLRRVRRIKKYIGFREATVDGVKVAIHIADNRLLGTLYCVSILDQDVKVSNATVIHRDYSIGCHAKLWLAVVNILPELNHHSSALIIFRFGVISIPSCTFPMP